MSGSTPDISSRGPEIDVVRHGDTDAELYKIVGRYPKYFHRLLFETKEIAEEAKAEAEEVLETRERPTGSKFFDAHLEKGSVSKYSVVRE